MLPLRSFEHEGDYIHRDSTFVIRNSLCKSYLTGEYSFLGEKPSLNFKLRDKERESEGAFDRDVDSYNHPDYANKSFCLEKDKDSVDCVFGIAEKTMARLQMKSRIS